MTCVIEISGDSSHLRTDTTDPHYGIGDNEFGGNLAATLNMSHADEFKDTTTKEKKTLRWEDQCSEQIQQDYNDSKEIVTTPPNTQRNPSKWQKGMQLALEEKNAASLSKEKDSSESNGLKAVVTAIEEQNNNKVKLLARMFEGHKEDELLLRRSYKTIELKEEIAAVSRGKEKQVLKTKFPDLLNPMKNNKPKQSKWEIVATKFNIRRRDTDQILLAIQLSKDAEFARAREEIAAKMKAEQELKRQMMSQKERRELACILLGLMVEAELPLRFYDMIGQSARIRTMIHHLMIVGDSKQHVLNLYNDEDLDDDDGDHVDINSDNYEIFGSSDELEKNSSKTLNLDRESII